MEKGWTVSFILSLGWHGHVNVSIFSKSSSSGAICWFSNTLKTTNLYFLRKRRHHRHNGIMYQFNAEAKKLSYSPVISTTACMCVSFWGTYLLKCSASSTQRFLQCLSWSLLKTIQWDSKFRDLFLQWGGSQGQHTESPSLITFLSGTLYQPKISTPLNWRSNSQTLTSEMVSTYGKGMFSFTTWPHADLHPLNMTDTICITAAPSCRCQSLNGLMSSRDDSSYPAFFK